jgi:hypothetical protein
MEQNESSIELAVARRRSDSSESLSIALQVSRSLVVVDRIGEIKKSCDGFWFVKKKPIRRERTFPIICCHAVPTDRFYDLVHKRPQSKRQNKTANRRATSEQRRRKSKERDED